EHNRGDAIHVADQRLRGATEEVPAHGPAGSTGARSGRRRGGHLPVLLRDRRSVPLAPGAVDDPLHEFRDRHRGRRCRAAHDRWRVRPVRGCLGHGRGADDVDDLLRAAPQPLGRRARQPGPDAAHRIHQRLPRREDGDPQLPGDAQHVLHAPGPEPGCHAARHRHRGHAERLGHGRLRLCQGRVRVIVLGRRRHRAHLGPLVARLRPAGDVDPAPHPCRQLDLRRRRERRERTGRRCAGQQSEDRLVHGRLVPRLVPRPAHPVPAQHRAVGTGRGPGVPLHHRGGRRWRAADRRLRLRHRLGHRRVHLRHDDAGHRLRRLGPELVLHLPRRDAPDRRDGEPVRQELRHEPEV
ncbi:MAG: Inositol transport system permease protein, partial [uncultured Frankineae bacterium]